MFLIVTHLKEETTLFFGNPCLKCLPIVVPQLSSDASTIQSITIVINRCFLRHPLKHSEHLSLVLHILATRLCKARQNYNHDCLQGVIMCMNETPKVIDQMSI